jgi:hypothetical protein
MRFLVAFSCAVLWSTAAMAGDVAGQFTAFCEEWMGKLAARQEHNVSHIKWDTKQDGVKGEYVGYTTEHTCTLKNETKVPIGKIIYREIVYQKSGGSVPEAEKSAAEAIETTEVTEIFRYDGGKWVY